MCENFDALSTVADRIALIAAVQSYLLRDNFVVTLDDLQYHFKECINSLSYELATKATTAVAKNVVNEAWGKFITHREKLQDKFSQDIVRLTRASEVESKTKRT